MKQAIFDKIAVCLDQAEDLFEAGRADDGIVRLGRLLRALRNELPRAIPALSAQRMVAMQDYRAEFATTCPAPSDAPRVILISDSGAMPRPGSGITLADSYPARLAGLFGARAAIDPYPLNGRIIEQALATLQALRPPSVPFDLIIQVGTVDCIARTFDAGDYKKLDEAAGPDAADRLRRLLRRHAAALTGERRHMVLTQTDKFTTTLDLLIAATRTRLKPRRLLLIGLSILPTGAGRSEDSPDVINALEYNDILRSRAGGDILFLSPIDAFRVHAEPLDCFADDKIHMGLLGHQLLAAAIYDKLA